MIGVDDIGLPIDPVRLSVQTIVGLTEELRNPPENSGKVRLIARLGAVLLDRVAQQYARSTAGLGTDQLWAALRRGVRRR